MRVLVVLGLLLGCQVEERPRASFDWLEGDAAAPGDAAPGGAGLPIITPPWYPSYCLDVIEPEWLPGYEGDVIRVPGASSPPECLSQADAGK